LGAEGDRVMKYGVSLTIMTETRDTQANAVRAVTRLASDMAINFSEINVSAYTVDEDEIEVDYVSTSSCPVDHSVTERPK